MFDFQFLYNINVALQKTDISACMVYFLRKFKLLNKKHYILYYF